MRRSWLVLCALLGCVAGPTGGALEVLYDGCDQLGERCVLPAEGGALRLWVAEGEPLEVRLDGRPAAAERTPVDGGQHLRVPIPAGARALSVVGETSGASFQLELGEQPELPTKDEVDCDGPPPIAPAHAAMTEVHCAWADVREGADEAVRQEARASLPSRLAEAATVLQDSGLHTEAARVRSAAIFMATRRGDDALAWDLVALLPREGTAEGLWIAANMEALVAVEAAHYDRADRALVRAERLLLRLDMPQRRVESTAGLRALTAAGLGDLDGALATWQEIAALHPPSASCDRRRAVALENTAWFELLRRRTGAAPTPSLEPRARLLEARDAYDVCGISAHDRAKMNANLAFEAWYRASWGEALEAATKVDGEARPQDLAWALTVRADSLSALGRPDEALTAARRAVSVAAESSVPDALPFAHHVAAEAALAAGQPRAAREHLALARDGLFERLPDVPSHVDPAAFFGMHLRATPGVISRSVELALQDGDPEAAFTLLRRLRGAATRSLRRQADLGGLDAATRARWEAARAEHERLRQDLAAETAGNWSLSGEALDRAVARQARQREHVDRALSDALAVLPAETSSRAPALRTPEPDERIVGLLPVSGRWLIFVASSEETRVVEGPSADLQGDALLDGLVRLLLDEIGEAERLTLLPWGEVHDLDLHVHAVDGIRLVDRVDLAWSLDLPPVPAPDATGGVVVIADPDGSLPAARAEAEALAVLPSARVLQGDEATREASLAALEGAQAWHFAGHGRLDPERGWRSGLQLADGRLEVADLLGLNDPPLLAVLSGCETGRAPRRHGVATLGIAQALVLTGGGAVVASSRPVDDTAAARQVAGLLVESSTPDDLVRRLNSLQRSHMDDPHVGAWRVWTR